MKTIYHLIKRVDWDGVKDKMSYRPPSLNEVGFIHCSTKDQVLPTAERRYANENIVVLAIDTEKVPSKIIFEDPKNKGEEHPHIYGELPISAVKNVLELKKLQT